MVTLTVETGGAVPTAGPILAPVREFTLRAIGAALQILATIAVVRVLPPTTAGIYFKGFVIAYGLSALLRGKYDLFVAHYFAGAGQLDFGVSPRGLVRALGIRVLIRSALACAVLLVITADLDVMEWHLRPYLQTYLPFVLAVPFATLAWFLASVLRAVNRTLGSTMVSSYCMNVAILIAAAVITWTELPLETAFLVLSWAFFAGAALAALLGVAITRRLFGVAPQLAQIEAQPAAWKEIYASAARNGFTGLALAALQWGPLGVLALFGPEAQIAQFAVATRTAQVIDLLVPAVIFVPQGILIHSRLTQAMRSARGKLLVDLAVSLATTSAYVLAVAILTPWFVGLYGNAYTGLTAVFAVLFATQWIYGAGRPAIRHLVADWHLGRIRRILVISATVAVVLSLAGVMEYGPLAAAVGVLVGAVLQNGQALASAFRFTGRDYEPAV